MKNYGASQAVYRRTRSSHSKAFIYLKSLNIICDELLPNEVAKCRMPVFEKNFFTYLPSCILPSFSKNASQLLPPKRLWKCARKISFRKYKPNLVLLVIYLFNYHSSSCHYERFLSNKLEFIATQRLLKPSFLV